MSDDRFSHRLSSKRKLDDYGPTDDDDSSSSDLVSVRMRKVEPNAVNSISTNQTLPPHHHLQPRVSDSSSSSSSFRSLSRLQFFVRLLSHGNNLVIQANSDDTVQSIHERIYALTGIPVIEQRLIYRGKQLQWEQTLAECSIQNDAGLQLVGRMRSTQNPKSWQVIDEMVSLIFGLCKGEPFFKSSKPVKLKLVEFLQLLPGNDSSEGDSAAHLQIFVSSSAPAALVMLYMSPIKGNKECADESIRHFVSWIGSTKGFQKYLHSQFATIMLEFCKLLGRAVAHEDPLYLLCRSCLGSMMENFRIGVRSKKSCDNSSSRNKESISVEEVFPFFSEIAVRLSSDLALNKLCAVNSGQFSSDVRDFRTFFIPIRKAIIGELAGNSILAPFCVGRKKFPCYEEEIKFLYGFFLALLENMGLCLLKIEEFLTTKEKREDQLGWCHYLAILKQMSVLSKLFIGAEDQFCEKLRSRRVSVCYLIVKYAKRSDDHGWLLEYKDVTDFESRRHLAMMMFPDSKDEYEDLHEMLIDRSQLLAESFEYVTHAESDALRGGLFMEFKNEEATGPGVLREWFLLVCQAIFNPQNALFLACPNDRRRFFPNPASKVDPLHLEYFRFSGRVIALALMHKVQVGIVFDRVFFLQLAGKNVSLEDIRDADPCLYNSCKKILEMDAEMVESDALGLTFVREVEELGSWNIVELCPGGKSIAVNSSNREKYVNLLIKHQFVTSITEQVARFAQGFADILCDLRHQKSFFRSLEPEDLDWMLYGSESAISVDDWKAHTDYNGYKKANQQIRWFWKIVGKMSAEQRKVLLFFWTSVKYLPVNGFGGLASRLYIYKSSGSNDLLPSSHTCFHRLCLPTYPSMTIMQDRLHIITQEHVGCSFGTW